MRWHSREIRERRKAKTRRSRGCATRSSAWGLDAHLPELLLLHEGVDIGVRLLEGLEGLGENGFLRSWGGRGAPVRLCRRRREDSSGTTRDRATRRRRGGDRRRDGSASGGRRTPRRRRRVRAHHFARSLLRDVSVRGEEWRRPTSGGPQATREESVPPSPSPTVGKSTSDRDQTRTHTQKSARKA